MASNLHKRLDKIAKQIALLNKGENVMRWLPADKMHDPEAYREELIEQGSIKPRDTLLFVRWLTEEEETERLRVIALRDGPDAEGMTAKNTEHTQCINIPWHVNALTGDKEIPDHTNIAHTEIGTEIGAEEGATSASEGLDPPPFPSETWQMREEWEKHVRRITGDGTRYDPDKPKPVSGIY